MPTPQPPPSRYSVDRFEEVIEPTVIPGSEFQALFLKAHRAGEHISIVGVNGSGKTVGGLIICRLLGTRMAKDGRPARVTVLAYKPRDDTMRLILPEKEWPIVSKWPPSYGQEHCIVWVRGGPASRATRRQLAIFGPLLDEIYQEGNQTVYVPEAAHFERPMPYGLGLGGLMTEIWSAARSNKLTMISDTQRPRNVTASMWTEPKWIFIFRVRDRRDLKRVGELAGMERTVYSIVPRLGEHEFMCIRCQEDTEAVYVSKFDLP